MVLENSSTNGTSDLVVSVTSPTPEYICVMVLLCVIFILGFTGNGLVIYVTGFRMKTTVNSVWFLNLALADFICNFTLITSIILSFKETHTFEDFVYIFFNTVVRVLSMLASIFLLTIISLDRCLTVWMPVWARNKRTTKKARLICVFVWLMSLVFSIPIGYANDIGVDALVDKWLATLQFVVGFLIPFLIITCCYVAIGVRVSQLKREKRIRPFLIILVVIMAFFIFWLPFHIVNLIITDQIYIYSIDPENANSDVFYMAAKMYMVSLMLAFLQSCLNPFLYMFMCEEFKQKLKQSVFLVLEHAFLEEEITTHQSSNLAL